MEERPTMAVDTIVMDSIKARDYRVSLGGLNPTGASMRIIDEFGREQLVGTCHRQQWYKRKGVEKTNLPRDENLNKMEIGNAMEDNLQAHWSRQGVMLAGNIKVYENIGEGDEDITISGEVDVLLREALKNEDGRLEISNDTGIGIEVKSGRGFFQSKKIMGNRNKLYARGYPKHEHIMQVALYLRMRKALEDHYDVTIPYFLIVYYLVDSGETTQFRLELSDGYTGEIIVKDRDGTIIKPNAGYAFDMKLEEAILPTKIQNMTTDNLLNRYRELQVKLLADEPPEREFELRYSDVERVEEDFKLGVMTKSRFEDYMRNDLKTIGDWQCSFCDWRDHCYPQGVLTVDVEKGILTVEEAMSRLG
ncbi:MAG: hypothetical protein ACTSPB_05540 [Candidatus Thorarchaeota archaeon]